jgi:GntR family transcriptional repressor for pyruvate dehydrogenase complex
MIPFHPVKAGKISQLITQQIRDSILNGFMKPGERLPAERALVERFQASRISIREALKSLEASGLLTIKPGSGVFVAEVSSRPVIESFSSVLRLQKTSLNELTEARTILEPSIAKLASERMLPGDLLKLERNIQETLTAIKSNSPSLTSTKNIEFHSLIAESTQNTVITLTMKTLFDVVKEMTLEITDNLPKRKDISGHAMIYHKKILRAFQEKDHQKVYKLMLKHILQIQGGFRKIGSKTK